MHRPKGRQSFGRNIKKDKVFLTLKNSSVNEKNGDFYQRINCLKEKGGYLQVISHTRGHHV